MLRKLLWLFIRSIKSGHSVGQVWHQGGQLHVLRHQLFNNILQVLNLQLLQIQTLGTAFLEFADYLHQ
jgi:hypothetical protein